MSCRFQLLLSQPLRGLLTGSPLPLPLASRAGAGRLPFQAPGPGHLGRRAMGQPSPCHVDHSVMVATPRPGDVSHVITVCWHSRLAPAQSFPLFGVSICLGPLREICLVRRALTQRSPSSGSLSGNMGSNPRGASAPIRRRGPVLAVQPPESVSADGWRSCDFGSACLISYEMYYDIILRLHKISYTRHVKSYVYKIIHDIICI